MQLKATSNQSIILAPPEAQDAQELYRLIDRSKPLDLNSEYLYLLLSTHFAETCVVAKMDGEVVAGATAYLIPNRPDTLFVWQIAVDQKVRKKGVAYKLLSHLMNRRDCRNVKFIEATVSPSNKASFTLFKNFAEKLKAPFQFSEYFKTNLFLDPNHESEDLIRIGPIERESNL